MLNTIENVNNKVNVNEVIGHFVEAELSLNSWYGKVKQRLVGRIIYSEYNASLFFKPKGNKNRGYLIENEDDIHSVAIIRKDNKNHKYYAEAYDNKEVYEIEREKRLEAERKRREKEEQLRRERFEMERQIEKEKKQKEIDEARQLGGYDELEKEVFDYYNSFEGEFYNENFVKTIVMPLLNKLIHKSIENVNAYPKYYFDKKHNKKFCALIEKRLGIKLPNTQKGSVEVLNKYLSE